VRPALPILREIEKTSQNIASKLDSRLASNGILPFPQEADFPQGRNPDGSAMSTASSVAAFLMEAMTAGMQNPGTAAAQAPIVLTMPGDMIQTFSQGWMDLSSTLDGAVLELRQNALTRLANTLDMPRDVAEGTQSEANHWGAWQVEETTYKVYIEPLLQRVADAITEFWFRPALVALGVADPERYVIDWDTSAIVKRPDATEDLNWLYERRLISDDYRRSQSGIPDDAVPDEDEVQRRLLVDIVTGAPTLAADPTIGRELFGFEVVPEAAGVSSDAVDAVEGDDSGSQSDTRALPATQNDTAPQDDGGVPDGLTAAAELIVFDALSRAGGRLLTAQHRGRFPDVPKHELHTVIASGDRSVNLLADSFLWTDGVADAFGLDKARFEGALYAFVKDRIETQTPYDRDALVACLRGLR
jgi:hypothetical protein